MEFLKGCVGWGFCWFLEVYFIFMVFFVGSVFGLGFCVVVIWFWVGLLGVCLCVFLCFCVGVFVGVGLVLSVCWFCCWCVFWGWGLSVVLFVFMFWVVLGIGFVCYGGC